MPDSFYNELSQRSPEAVATALQNVNEGNVLRALQTAETGHALSENEYLALLSEAATPHLERMVNIARDITLRHFGRSVQLFTPLYLSNFCTNRCVYCGFNTGNAIPRRKLSLDEIEAEGSVIAATGLRHILLLTGDAPNVTGPDYIAEAARRLRRHFPGISVEIYALSEQNYRLLAEAGVDGMTMFQETYNESLYADLHPAGPKRDFRFRLDAPDRAGRAGLRSLSLGALLGLDDWRRDSFFTALHAHWLRRRHPGAEIGISVPRMRPHAGSPVHVHPVLDRDLVQFIAAARLFLPMAGITVSSRERATFRDHLIHLGVTRVSAGVSTTVGGHVCATKKVEQNDTPQFEIADERSVVAMAEAIVAAGLQPVFKYWEPLDGAPFSCGTGIHTTEERP